MTSLEYYFPAIELSELNCYNDGENVVCHFGQKITNEKQLSTKMAAATTTVLRLNKTMNFKLEKIRSDLNIDDVDDFVTTFVTWSNGNKSNDDVTNVVNASYCESNKVILINRAIDRYIDR